MTVPVTGEVMTEDTYAPFTMGSPNGYELENCVGVHVIRSSYSDELCGKRSCGFCDLDLAPKIQIRGVVHPCIGIGSTLYSILQHTASLMMLMESPTDSN